MGNFRVLTYGVGQDGLFRVAVELPGGHTKQIVTVKGTDLGADFETSAQITVCSSIHVDTTPKVITFSEGILDHEHIRVKFSTYDFTPTQIYADLGTVEGTRCENTFLLPENEITDYKLVREGDQTSFYFEFPQGVVTEANGSTRKKKLSDLFDVSEMYSMSQPLVIGLEVSGDTYSVSNFDQLSIRNLITNFSSPIKFINADAYLFDILSVTGVEDTPGRVRIDMSIRKQGGVGLSNSSALSPASSSRSDGSQFTILNFSGGKFDVDKAVDPKGFVARNSYIANDKYDLLNQGTVFIRGRAENPGDTSKFYYPVNQSTTSNGFVNTSVTVEEDISDNLTGFDQLFRDVLLADFLPTHMKVHSDREGVSEVIPLILEEYNVEGGTVSEITLTPATPVYGSIMDNGNIQLELIDQKVTGFSFIKEVEIDRSTVQIPITTDLFGQYNVDIGFFKNANIQDNNAVTELFWNPIKIANDGTLGIPGKALQTNPVIYVRLESTRTINEVSGRILIGNNEDLISNSFTFNTDIGGDQGQISNLYPNVAYLKLDLSGIITPTERVNLKVNINLFIVDDDGNNFNLVR